MSSAHTGRCGHSQRISFLLGVPPIVFAIIIGVPGAGALAYQASAPIAIPTQPRGVGPYQVGRVLYLPQAVAGSAPLASPTPTALPSGPPGAWAAAASPARVVLLGASFAGNDVWAVGTGGTVLRSTGGQPFVTVDVGSTQDLYGVRFADSQTGVLVGRGGTIRRTADGGASWTTGASGTSADLGAIWLANAQIGWVTGNSGTILRTDDGGATWRSQNSGFDSDINAIHFAGTSTGWAVGNGGAVLATTDGGQNWSRRATVPTSLSTVYFQNSLVGWTGGDPTSSSNLFRTGDGGANWTRVSLPISGPAITSVKFVDANRGWAAAEERIVLSTKNGGQTWAVDVPQLKQSGLHYWLFGLDAMVDGSVVAVGGSYFDNGSFDPVASVVWRRSAGQ